MITISDIETKEFKKSAFGYSQDEVDKFLDEIILDYEKLIKENFELKEKVSNLNSSISNYRSIEKSLQTTLALAEKTADETLKNAEADKERIVSETRKQAETYLAQAKEKSETMLAEANTKSESILSEAKTKSEAMLAEANTKASVILEQANDKYEMVFGDTDRKLTEMKNSLEKLLERYDATKKRLRVIFEAEIRLLDKTDFNETSEKDIFAETENN